MMPGDARECRVMSGDVIVIGIGIGANDKWVGGGPIFAKNNGPSSDWNKNVIRNETVY